MRSTLSQCRMMPRKDTVTSALGASPDGCAADDPGPFASQSKLCVDDRQNQTAAIVRRSMSYPSQSEQVLSQEPNSVG